MLSPSLLYAFGAFLVLMGSARAYFLGWARRERLVEADLPDGGAGAEEEDESRSTSGRLSGYTPRKQMVVGLVWVALGLFLIVSTAIRARGL